MSCWKLILKNNFTKIEKLLDFLEFSPLNREHVLARSRFVLNLPYRLAQKMEKNNLDDPLFLQFVPLKLEEEIHPLHVMDPVGDCQARKSSKLLHKYQGRALMMPTSACAMHCRYCFRQNYPYETSYPGLDQELEWIAADTSLSEIILSGGDPLSWSNDKLKTLLKELSRIPHIKKIRFHTRFPIGIPERLDEELLAIFAEHPQQIWFVIHCNHPKELDLDVLAALTRVRKTGAVVLNQSVLLRGVNDDENTLCMLSEILTSNGIFPYYLHQLDRVQGAAHFEVPASKGLELIAAMKKRLAGYAVPKYVQEIASMPHKTDVESPCP